MGINSLILKDTSSLSDACSLLLFAQSSFFNDQFMPLSVILPLYKRDNKKK